MVRLAWVGVDVTDPERKSKSLSLLPTVVGFSFFANLFIDCWFGVTRRKFMKESWCSTFRTKISRVKSASFHSICKNHFSTRSNISVAESLFHSVWKKQSLTIKFSPMTSCSARDKCFCCYNVLRVGGTRHKAARSKSDGDRFKWMTMERSRCDCE